MAKNNKGRNTVTKNTKEVKQQSRNSKKYDAKATPKYSLLYLFPFIGVLGFIPAIVRLVDYQSDLSYYDWFSGNAQVWDFFLKGKIPWLYAAFIGMIFVMLFMWLSEEKKLAWDKRLIPIFVYAAFILISALFSVDWNHTWHGIYEQLESAWMLFGYVLTLYFAFYQFQNESAVERIIPFFAVGMVLISIWGIGQATGHDLLSYKDVLRFVVPEKYGEMNVSFSFEKGRVYSSLYNPNYVGSYVVLAVPVLIAVILHTKNWLIRIGSALLAAILVFLLYASQSRSGILVLAATFLLMLLFMRQVFMKHWKLTVGIIAIAIVGFIGVNIINQNILVTRIKSMMDTKKYNGKELESIVTGEDVTIKYLGNELHCTVEFDEAGNIIFHFVDADGNEIPIADTGDGTGTYALQDERFPFTCSRALLDYVTGFTINIPGTQIYDGQEVMTSKAWQFSNEMVEDDDEYYVKGYGAALFKMKPIEKGPKFLEDHYQIANGRGYIWARTIPLLKKYIFKGSGPDTFVIAFPNDDLVGMWNGSHEGEIITKPHCMYLQIAVQTGVISLIAFLVYFGWYLVDSFRLYWKQSYDSYVAKIGLAALISVIGYLIMGITNDSCLAVAPVFFAIAGMGQGINHHLRQQRNIQQRTAQPAK